jgi:hypothetical protein
MSLFLSLSSDQYHSKPMAISSITSPVGAHSSSAGAGGIVYDSNSPATICPSPSSSSTQSDTVSPPPTSSKSGSSSPQSRSFSNYSAYSSTSSFSSSPNSSSMMKHKSSINNNALPPPPSTSYYHPYHHCVSPSRGVVANDVDSDNATPTSTPLSLHERRLRNKTASAKYRAKKNQQHGEMRAMISSLTKENELLLRQLDHVQNENGHLKANCDRLRGKIMAQKMLKQYLVESEQQQQQKQNSPTSVSAAVPPTMDSNCFIHCHSSSATDHRKFPDIEEKGDWDDRD